MFWQKIGNSVSGRLFCNSVIVENQCLYLFRQSRIKCLILWPKIKLYLPNYFIFLLNISHTSIIIINQNEFSVLHKYILSFCEF